MAEGQTRARLLLAMAVTATGCVLPEPINYEPPPSQQTDEVPIIQSTDPASHVVVSQQSGAIPNRGCFIEVALDQVEDDDLLASLTARFYANESNPAVQAPLAQDPLFFGLIADLPLSVASEDTPAFRQLYPPKRIDLDPLVGLGLLTPLPSDGSPGDPNYLEVFVSDGFDLTTLRPAPAPGRALTSTFWFLDLSACDPRVP
ncbi:MAG: hypothetical protein ACYCWW_04075 [Deltaproteobacteria bacterium]